MCREKRRKANAKKGSVLQELDTNVHYPLALRAPRASIPPDTPLNASDILPPLTLQVAPSSFLPVTDSVNKSRIAGAKVDLSVLVNLNYKEFKAKEWRRVESLQLSIIKGL